VQEEFPPPTVNHYHALRRGSGTERQP
jgi:hypothetical protein